MTWPTVPAARTLPAPGSYLCGLTYDGEYLWHSDQEAQRIWAIDPTTGTVVRELVCTRVRADLTHHDGSLWQVGGRPKRVVMVDPVTGAVTGEKPVHPASGRLCGIETGPDGVWLCLRSPAVLQLRDVQTLTVQRELPIDGSPSGLTYVDGIVLYGDFDAGVVRAVDTHSGELLATVGVDGSPTGLTWDGQHVWYCDFATRRLTAIQLDDVVPFVLEHRSRLRRGTGTLRPVR